MKTNNQQSVEKQIPGKFPTNLKNYLQIAHTEVYAVLLEKRGSWKEDQSGNGVGKGAEKECERKAGSLKASHQLTLAKSLKSWQIYEKSSQQHAEITKNLAVFVGSFYIVENLELCDLLATLHNHYTTPSRTLLVKEAQKVLIELKARIGTFLHEARKIHIYTDV